MLYLKQHINGIFGTVHMCVELGSFLETFQRDKSRYQRSNNLETPKNDRACELKYFRITAENIYN